MSDNGAVISRPPVIKCYEVLGDGKRMRVFFFYDYFWFCIEGPYSGTKKWKIEIENARARGTFLDKETAEKYLPAPYKSWTENKLFIRWRGTKGC